MLEHPRSWDEDGQKARQPFDFVVAGLRALEVPAEALEPNAVTSRRPGRAAMATPQDGAPEMTMMATDEAGTEDVAVEMSAGGADAATATVLAVPTADGRVPIRANPLSVGALQRLGQPLWRPPSPAGWDEELSVWITAAQLTQRIDWARALVARFGGDRDPRRFVAAALGDIARDDTIQVVSQAPSRQAGLVLALASPEFNRR